MIVYWCLLLWSLGMICEVGRLLAYGEWLFGRLEDVLKALVTKEVLQQGGDLM